MVQPLQLNRDIDIAPLAAGFAKLGYGTVDSVPIKPSARRLRDGAKQFDGWNLVTVLEGQHREFVAADMERLDPRGARRSMPLWRAKPGVASAIFMCGSISTRPAGAAR